MQVAQGRGVGWWVPVVGGQTLDSHQKRHRDHPAREGAHPGGRGAAGHGSSDERGRRRLHPHLPAHHAHPEGLAEGLEFCCAQVGLRPFG